jgi:hypothetical protein
VLVWSIIGTSVGAGGTARAYAETPVKYEKKKPAAAAAKLNLVLRVCFMSLLYDWKSTVGALSAPVSAWKYGKVLKPKMPAVRLVGNV